MPLFIHIPPPNDALAVDALFLPSFYFYIFISTVLYMRPSSSSLSIPLNPQTWKYSSLLSSIILDKTEEFKDWTFNIYIMRLF